MGIDMSFAIAWSGDWRGRIQERIREHGCATVTEYVDSHPGASLYALAKKLDPEAVAAAQLGTLVLEEARRNNTIPRALGDLLVRELREELPGGWERPLDEDARSRVASALERWQLELHAHLDEADATMASRDLLEAALPRGWLPTGPDDPVIVAFVDRCMGRRPC